MKYFHSFVCSLLCKTSFQQGINGWGNKLVKLQVSYLIAFNAWAILFSMSQGLDIFFTLITIFYHSATVQFYMSMFFFASAFLKFFVHCPYNSLMILMLCLSLRMLFREQDSQPSFTPGSCRDSQTRISLISSPCLQTGNTKEKT